MQADTALALSQLEHLPNVLKQFLSGVDALAGVDSLLSVVSAPVLPAPPLLRHAAGQRQAWLRSASRSVSSCSLDEFMSDERCSARVTKTSESVSQ